MLISHHLKLSNYPYCQSARLGLSPIPTVRKGWFPQCWATFQVSQSNAKHKYCILSFSDRWQRQTVWPVYHSALQSWSVKQRAEPCEIKGRLVNHCLKDWSSIEPVSWMLRMSWTREKYQSKFVVPPVSCRPRRKQTWSPQRSWVWSCSPCQNPPEPESRRCRFVRHL